MGPVNRFLFGTTILFCLMTQPCFGSTKAAVQSALDWQGSWLESSSEGDGWNEYLLTSELKTELEKAAGADKRMVARILARYDSGTPGLGHPHFAATRARLTDWANELGVPMAARWAEQLRTSSPQAGPISDTSVQKARGEVRDSVQALDTMLSSADTATKDGWKKFLKWDKLEEQMQLGTPNWGSLSDVGAQFFDGHPGLEYPEFVRVRNSLRKYLYLGELGSNGKGQKAIRSQLNGLADALDRYNREPSTKHAAEVAQIVDWLDQLDRVPELAKAIRDAHSKPNVKLRVGEGLVSRRFSQDVNEPMDVNEWILGTHVRGKAKTRGHISTDIVTSPNVARVDIVFRGTTTTRTVGRQKPVTVVSSSSTALEARKPLYIYPSRVTTSPAVARTKTASKIHSITPDRKLGSRLVEKIAWKKASEQKPKTEQIASARAARRLEKQIDQQTSELLTRAQEALRQQLSGPINRRGLLPESIGTRSVNNCAIVFAKQATSAQFAATTEPPNFCPHDEVVAQIHESAVNNTAEKAIAGLTLNDVRIAELTEELTGSVPEELQISDTKQPWSISFDWQQPVTVEFDDETLTIAVRGRKFTSGDRVLNKVMEMSATYSMQTTENGVNLTRQGDVSVRFPTQRSGKRLTAMDRVFSTLMEKKFSEVFKPTIQGEGFELPGRFEQLGRLRLKDLSTKDGWLSLGWQ